MSLNISSPPVSDSSLEDFVVPYKACFVCSDIQSPLNCIPNDFYNRLYSEGDEFIAACSRRSFRDPGFFKSFSSSLLDSSDQDLSSDWTKGPSFEDESNDRGRDVIKILSGMIHRKLFDSWQVTFPPCELTLSSTPVKDIVKRLDSAILTLELVETTQHPDSWFLERYTYWLFTTLRDHLRLHEGQMASTPIVKLFQHITIFFDVCQGKLPYSFLGIYNPSLEDSTFKPQMDLVTRYLMKQDSAYRREVVPKKVSVKKPPSAVYKPKKDHHKKNNSFNKRMFVPQGFMPDVSVNLDSESREFLMNLADSLKKTDFKLNHNVNFGDSTLFSGLKLLSDYDYCVYLGLLMGVTYMIAANKGSKLLLQAIQAWLSYKLTLSLLENESFIEIVHDFVMWLNDDQGDGSFTPQVSGDTIRESFVGLVMAIYAGRRVSSTDIAKVIADMPRTMNGVTFIWDKIVGFIESCLRSMNSNWSLIQMGFLSGVSPIIGELEREVDEFLRVLDKDSILSNVNITRVAELDRKMRNAARTLPHTPEFGVARSRLRDLVNLFQPTVALANRFSSKGMGIRSQPLGIMIMGPPGVGKTLSIPQIVTELLAAVLPDDEVEDFSRGDTFGKYFYVRDYQNEFWDNYHNQFAIHFDDFGQVQDKGLGPSEAMEIFRIANTNPMPCRMAELTDKGATWCNARLLTATTNRDRFDHNSFKSITSVDALNRRFQVAVLLVPKPEYCVDPNASIKLRKLDRSKVGMDFDTNVHEFHFVDLYTGNLHGTPLGYDDFVDHCVEKFHENSVSKVSFEKANKVAIQRGIARRKGKFRPQGNEDFPIPDYVLFETKFRNHLIAMASGLGIDTEMVFSCAAKHNLYTFDDFNNNFDAMEDFHAELDLRTHIDAGFMDSLKRGFLKFITENKKLISSVAAFATAVIVCKVALPLFNDGEPPFPMSAQDGSYIDEKTHSRANAIQKPKAPKFRKGGKTVYGRANRRQMAISSTSETLGIKILKSNGYRLLLDADSNVESGTILFISGRTAIMPVHFLQEIYSREDSGFYEKHFIGFKKIGSPNIIHRYKLQDLDAFTFDECEDKDLGFIVFPNSLQTHMNIRKYFIDDLVEEVGDLIFMALVKPSQNLNDVVMINSQASSKTCSIRYDDETVDVKGLVYNIATRNGDCGAFCLVSDARLSRPIIAGIHISGDNRARGVCNLVTRRILDKAMESDSSEPFEDEVEFDLTPQFLGDNVSYIKKMKPHSMNIRTTLRRSDYYGAWSKPTCKPARLHLTNTPEKIPIIDISRSKYGIGNSGFDELVLSQVTSEYLAHLYRNSTNTWDSYGSCEVYKFKDVITGVPGVIYLDGIPRQTSLGYPLCLKYTDGKRKVFGYHDHYTFSTPGAAEVQEMVNKCLEDLKNGIRPLFIYSDFLKDERRPIAKVDANKTRMVSGCSVIYTIIYRMYFMKFMRWCMIHRIGNDIAVGSDVYSQDWKLICDKMCQFGKRSIAGDFSNWDGSVQQALQYKCLDIIENFYHSATPEDKKVRRLLWLEVVNSRHIVNGFVYEMVGSVPSGHPMTSIINSICNALVTRYCIVHAQCGGFSDFSLVTTTIRRLSTDTAQIYYGDDNGISLSKNFDRVNMSNLSESFKTIGMTYTDEIKSGEVHELRDWLECEFLKRSFVLYRDVCLSPLRLDVVLEMSYWRKHSSKFSDQHVVASTALSELAQHSPQVFNKFAPKFLKKMSSLGFFPVVTDQMTLRRVLFEKN